MTRKTDLPWALDNNPQWDEFRKLAEGAGLLFRPMMSWQVEDYKTRGDNYQKFVVYYGERRVLVTSFIVEGYGPDGFALWLMDERTTHQPTIDHFVNRGKAREALAT